MQTIKNFFNDISDMPLTTILFLIAIVGLANYLILSIYQLFIPPQKLDIYADIFSKLSIGFGAISAGLGGFRYLSHYLGGEIVNIRRKDYLKLYPQNDFTARYDIVNHKSNLNDLYLRDKHKKIVRHIGNRYTYRELGWASYKTNTIEDKIFNKYTKGDVILIRGIVGE